MPSIEALAVARDIAAAMHRPNPTGYTGDSWADHLLVQVADVQQRPPFALDALGRFVNELASRLDALPVEELPSMGDVSLERQRGLWDASATAAGISPDRRVAFEAALDSANGAGGEAGVRKLAARSGIDGGAYDAWMTELRSMRAAVMASVSGRLLHFEYDTPDVVAEAARAAGIDPSALASRLPTKVDYELRSGAAMRVDHGMPGLPLTGDLRPGAVDSRFTEQRNIAATTDVTSAVTAARDDALDRAVADLTDATSGPSTSDEPDLVQPGASADELTTDPASEPPAPGRDLGGPDDGIDGLPPVGGMGR